MSTGPTRETGAPPSANGASSMHLWWGSPALDDRDEVVEVSVRLTIDARPAVARLYFWAVQASFVDGRGRRHGAAHLGLQWHPAHPRSTAVNFGGYRERGGELDGTGSPLPSARGNPNTRDFAWVPGRPYRLAIVRAASGQWAGVVDDLEVRRLHCGGDRLAHVVVWSEVFAGCDDPTVVARWSDLGATTADGRRLRAHDLVAGYQTFEAGGCTNTTARAVAGGVEQWTNARREVAAGERLALPPNGLGDAS
jgi:hypothetical protein